MEIQKASGKTEEFSKAKFCRSLKRAGVSASVCEDIYSNISHDLKPGTPTSEIYRRAFAYLKKKDTPSASRYSLKKAIMDLGPAGFLFEQYIEAIFLEYGYKTKRGQMMRGECVAHEIDVLAEKDNAHYLVEAKYHNSRGIKSDIQVVMYAFARTLDIAEHHKQVGEKKMHHTWVVTNTKFTSKAKAYAECKGIHMSGWHYPRKGNLEDMIESKNLYPVTVLISVNRHARERFAAAGILFARDIARFTVQDLERRFQIQPSLAKRIVNEAAALTN